MLIGAIGNQTGNMMMGAEGGQSISGDKKLSFDNLLNTVDAIEDNQLGTRASIYTMLTTGKGDTHEALIAMQKATSQIKTASVVRDKFIESYQAIMNMQI